MKTVVLASVLLVAVVLIVSSIIFATGFHQNFLLGQAIFLLAAIGSNIAVVVWALSRTAATSSYGQQLLHAIGIGVVAGLLIVATSWAQLTFVFPNVLAEQAEAAVAYMADAGLDEEQVAAQKEMLAKTTPMSQAIPGGIGTFATSLVVGAVVAIWKRRR